MEHASHSHRLGFDHGELDDLLRELGVVQGEFLPDDQAPAVDRERLQALLRRELPPDEAVHVAELTVLFRSWHEAFNAALGGGLGPTERGRVSKGAEEGKPEP